MQKKSILLATSTMLLSLAMCGCGQKLKPIPIVSAQLAEKPLRITQKQQAQSMQSVEANISKWDTMLQNSMQN